MLSVFRQGYRGHYAKIIEDGVCVCVERLCISLNARKHTRARPHTRTRTHTHAYIYIYIYMCVCVCVCLAEYDKVLEHIIQCLDDSSG